MMNIKVTAHRPASSSMKQHQSSRPHQSHATIRWGSVEQQLPQQQPPQPLQPLLQCRSSSPSRRSRPRVASASSLIAERPKEATKPRAHTVTILAFDNSVIN